MNGIQFCCSIALFALLSLFSSSSLTAQEAATLKWYSWEEAVAAAEKEPRKFFVDVYTDWCGWCKRMDKQTFTDPEVAAYLAENFYPVKFNAEQKEAVSYRGHELQFRGEAGRRGSHDLAIALLDGRMSYPSFVYLDAKQDRITISPGFKTPDVLMKELQYIGGDHYLQMTFEEYKSR